MSIIIKGMEMPQSCDDCPMAFSVNFGILCTPTHNIIGDSEISKRQGFCPLVPVPPHGRLIDADSVEKQIDYVANLDWNKKVGASGGMLAALEIVEDAPTILEAEEGE